MTNSWQVFLVALQVFQLAFLLLHDWMPLGRLNDISAIRRTITPLQRLVGLLVPGIPVFIALSLSLKYFGIAYPGWVRWWLRLTYSLLFLGEVEAWWIPYLFGTTAERVALYHALFVRTHSFLPPRHGIVVNTLHVVLHASTLMTVIILLTN
ncbi:MAG: hypothetical protein WB869_01370 [Candidatus Acidiferrales bacterium]